jgi:hypothetical protein
MTKVPDVPPELLQSIKHRRAILFAGAGLSMSVGLPSWRMLIDHMVEELGLDPAAVSETSYQTLAEYYRLKQGSIGPLRSWMDRHWHVPRDKVAKSRIHELIVDLDFPIVYTTNYDRNLEVAFEIHARPFVKVANAKDIAKIADDATQIVKYHGDFDDDNSLVLAETDYFKRLSFDSPLDIKFRADALGRTILFVGYSMSDTNIRLLLHRLWETWSMSGYQDERPKSFAFMPREDPIQSAVLSRWGVTLITGTSDDPEDALCAFLTAMKEGVDALSDGHPGVRAASPRRIGPKTKR